jgi:serine phosphatase RsbU (regulator of sigma subunit)
VNRTIWQEVENYWRVFVAVSLVMLYFMAGFVFVLSPYHTYVWADKPFPGFLVEQTLLVGVHNGRDWGARSHMQHLQLVTALNDQPVASGDDFNRYLAQTQPGQTIKVDIVEQDGRKSSYPNVSLIKFPKRDLLRLFWLPYGIGILYLVLGVWVFWRRGYSISGQAFAYFCVCTSLAIVLLFDVVSTHAMVDLWSISVAQLGGALATLALFFPVPVPLLRRQRWLAAVPFFISGVLSIWSMRANFATEDPWAYVSAWEASYFYAVVGILFFLGTLVYRLKFGTSPEMAQQARLILWGSFFAFTPTTFWFISSFLGWRIPWNPVLFLPMLMIFPAVIAAAIVRHRLWELEIIINRTLVYSVLTVMLGTIFLSSVVVLEMLLSNLIPRTTTVSAALSSMAITLMFSPLRVRVQRFIDRRFFREKYDIASTITVFQNSVRDTIDLEVLESRLKVVIQETMHPEHITLCTCSPDHDAQHFYIEEEDPLRGMLLASQGGVDVSRLRIDSPALEKLRQDRVTLTIPLTSQGELIGVLNLGPRRSGQAYSFDDRQLLVMLAAQVAPALRVANLVRQQKLQTLEQERMRQEMQVASLIQKALLPKNTPDLEGWKIEVDYQPARAVSGDFYDFYIRDGKLVLLVGDVTDKGMPAALVMASTRSILRGTARRGLSPGRALEQANDILVAEMLPYMFVTCFYSVLDLKTGHFIFSNAGHCLPVHRSLNGTQELHATGFPLGLFEDARYEEIETWLAPEDSVLLYSDGLIEAHNDKGEMFGVERVLDILNKVSNEHILGALKSALEKHGGKVMDPEDDTTVLCLHRKDVVESSLKQSVETDLVSLGKE